MKTNPVFVALGLTLATTSFLPAQTATWTDAAAGQLLFDCGGSGQYYSSSNHSWTQEASYGAHPCSGEGTVTRDLSNWSTAAYPDGTGIDVVINGGSPVELSSGVDVGTLSVGAAGVLNINGYGTLSVHGGSIVNNGMINLIDVSSGTALLRLSAPASLTGSGTITFATDDDCVIDSLTPADILTVGASQTLLAPAVAIAGTSASRIRAALINNGTITADVGGVLLDTDDKTNNSVIQAINGGTISIADITLNNASGTLTAGAGSTVEINRTTVDAGLLNGPGVIDILSGDATFNSGVTIAPETTIGVDGYDKLHINGTITNNGLIRLDDVSGDVAYLQITGNTTLAGSGQVLFKSNDDNWITSTLPEDVLTVGADQTLITSADALAGTSASRVMTALINEGTITADGGGLRLDTNDKTNNSTMQAINGGLLQFSGITLDNTNGSLVTDAASVISLENTTVKGGLITGNGTIAPAGSSATLDGVGLTIDTDVLVDIVSSDLLKLVGTVTNNGTISITDPGSGQAWLRVDGNVLLNGTGKVLFNSHDDNIIDSVLPTDVLTIGASQTLVTAASTIGYNDGSRIEAAVVNEGTIQADEGGLYLGTNNKTNNSVIEAINGGYIRVGPITVDNSAGTMTADATSSLRLDGATIFGGVLDGEGTIDLLTTDATFDGGLTIGAAQTVAIGNSDVLFLDSSITNNGDILIADSSSGIALLRINDSVTLNGTGRVVFNSTEDNHIDGADPAHVLTIGPDQELTTSTDTNVNYSILKVRTENNGTITAATGGMLFSENDKTNNSLIQTTGGGTIKLKSITLENAGGTLTLDPAGTLVMDGGTISGGLIDGSGTIDILTSDATLDEGVTIGAGVTVAIGTSDILWLPDTITNNGSILLTDTSSGQARIRIANSITLNGSGQVVFNQTQDNYIDASDPAHVLTIGPMQRFTTSDNSNVSWCALEAATVCNGVVEGNGGGLSLRSYSKTNAGIFRATAGGELEVQTADSILTNYNHATGTLTGGRWEVLSTDAGSVMDLQGAAITTLAPGTTVVLDGALSSFPALMVDTVQGTLGVHNQQVLNLGESDLLASGTLEFGLGDGGADGWDATRIDLDGSVNLSGCTINIVDQGMVPGVYELVHWTGALTGMPTLGSVPEGFSFSLGSDPNSLNLTVGGATPATPQILGIVYDDTTNTVTITYQSVDGVQFGVRGGDDVQGMSLLEPTAVGDGSIKQYTHQPEEGGVPLEEHYYQMINPAPDPS